jgi:hypothetical protein
MLKLRFIEHHIQVEYHLEIINIQVIGGAIGVAVFSQAEGNLRHTKLSRGTVIQL